VDETPHVASAFRQVEQDVADPLPRSVIGVASAPPRFDHFETRIEQFVLRGTGAGGVDGGMLQQPDEFRRLARRDRAIAHIHFCKRIAIGHLLAFATDFDGFGPAIGHRRLRGNGGHAYQGETQA
jgi:hypothetical protein